jgi:hypothetical protein
MFAKTSVGSKALQTIGLLSLRDGQGTALLAHLLASSPVALGNLAALLHAKVPPGDVSPLSARSAQLEGPGEPQEDAPVVGVAPELTAATCAASLFCSVLSGPGADPEHARIIADALLPPAAAALQRVAESAFASSGHGAAWPSYVAQVVEAALSRAGESVAAAADRVLDAATGLTQDLEQLLALPFWDGASTYTVHPSAQPSGAASWEEAPQQSGNSKAVVQRLCTRLQKADSRRRLRPQMQLEQRLQKRRQQQPGPRLQLQPPAQQQEPPMPACAGCGRAEAAGSGVRLRPCRGCRRVRYCGEECMRRQWPGHRAACKAAQAAAQQRE